ncbi:MAG: protein kinase [Deltaproteobacteria bacterium]|nr:protein kinase [Deltaproteobacteria bacterium]
MKQCPACQSVVPESARFCPSCGAALGEAVADSVLGTVIGDRYAIVERLGEGSSGVIYRAEHVSLRTKLALKLLHHQLSQDEEAIARFRDEATKLAQIDSEHIVAVSDFGRAADGRVFFAMEYLEGETLASMLAREGKLSEADTLSWLEQAVDALAEAHALALTHGDLRPRNIFLAKRKKRTVLKLLDFGLARLGQLPSTEADRPTASGVVDPRYMSPEQARGGAVDHRSDIYSLAVVAYEAISGKPPFVGSGTFDVLTKHLEAKAIPLKVKLPQISDPFSAAVQQAMAKKPEERFSDVETFFAALRGEDVTDTIRTAAPKQLRPQSSAPAPAPAPDAALADKPPAAGRRGAAAAKPAAGKRGAAAGKAAGGKRATSGAKPAAAAVAAAIPAPSPTPAAAPTPAVALATAAEPTPALDPTAASATVAKSAAVSATSSVSATSVSATSLAPADALADTVSLDAPESGAPVSAPVSAVVSARVSTISGPLQTIDSVSTPFSDADPLGAHTGKWFAEGVEAERQLQQGTKSGPLPSIYDGIDEEVDLPRRRISPSLAIGGVVALTVVALGIFAMNSGEGEQRRNKRPRIVLAGPDDHAHSARKTQATATIAVDASLKAPVAQTPVAAAPDAGPPRADSAAKLVAVPKAPDASVAKQQPDAVAVVQPTPAPAKQAKPLVIAPKAAPQPKPAAARASSPPERSKPEHSKPEHSKPRPRPSAPARTAAKKPSSVDKESVAREVSTGRTQLRRGSYGAARSAFQRAIALDARAAAAHGGLGEVAFEEGNYREATKHLLRAVRLDSQPRYLVMLGNAYFKQNRTKAAVMQYRRALQRSPNNPEAQSGLRAAIRRLASQD